MILAVNKKTGKQRSFTEAAWKHVSVMTDAGWEKLDENIIAKVNKPGIPTEITARVIENKKAEQKHEPIVEAKEESKATEPIVEAKVTLKSKENAAKN